MARVELDSIPRNLFQWSDTFNDDLGFEPISLGQATEAKPGSPEKIAVIDERLSRGQSIWHPDDAKDDDYQEGESLKSVCEQLDSYKIAGNGSYGAVVGQDVGGSKHRYAVWIKQPSSQKRPLRLLYVTEGCGYVDSFDHDAELNAIRRHAKIHHASFVAVVSLFTRRAGSALELRQAEYPITSVSLLWSRWLARHCDKVVACWGKTTRLERHIDYLWMLSRTAKGGQVYSVNESASYPEKLTVRGGVGLCRFEFRHLIADREKDEQEDLVDEDSGD